MSRIGKLPVIYPESVEIKIGDQYILIKGPKGELDVPILSGLTITQKAQERAVDVIPQGEEKENIKFWGLQRTLLANAVHGVTEGFEKVLEVNGVGFRVALQDKKLVLNLGFSHPVEYTAPDDVELKVEKTTITVSGIDKQQVGAVAAAIREFKKPEPYKGKGIKYSDEVIRRKAGKTAVKAAG